MRGRDNVFPIYVNAGVPVALATDDEAVIRADLTTSFVRAVEGYGASYPLLKKLVRDSLDYAFVPGASLWQAREAFNVVPVCAHDGAACQAFLAANERARLEWREERAFDRFEGVVLARRHPELVEGQLRPSRSWRSLDSARDDNGEAI